MGCHPEPYASSALLSQTGRRNTLCLHGHCILGCPSVRAVCSLFSITHLPMRKRRKTFCVRACVCVCMCECVLVHMCCMHLNVQRHGYECAHRSQRKMPGVFARLDGHEPDFACLLLPVLGLKTFTDRHKCFFTLELEFEFKFSCLLSKLFYPGSLLPRPQS